MKKRRAIVLTEPVGQALNALAEDILGDARSAIEDAGKSDSVAVHDFRKAMKRWRAFLRLLRPYVEACDGLQIEARDLSREFAGARDAQSALDALDDLAKGSNPVSPRSAAAIRSRIEAERREAEMSILNDAMRARMRDLVDSAAASIGDWPLSDLGFTDIAERLTDAYGRARKAIPGDWTAAGAEDLHRLRRRVVAHRYQMELVEGLWPKQGRLWIAEAQRLRDRLGAYQNLDVLLRMSEPGRALARWRAGIKTSISARQHAHLGAARRIAGRLFAEKPRAFRRRMESLWAAAT